MPESRLLSRRERPLTKVCKHCDQVKPIEEFPRKGTSLKGTPLRNPRCRTCVASIRRARVEAVLAAPKPADWPKCACGCGEDAPAAPYNEARKGWVKGQPLTWVKGHHARTDMNPTRQLGHVVTAAGCWEPKGRPSDSAYRQRRIDGEKVPAHRAAYVDAHGSVPEGCHVHHRCENKHCVNPAHLEAIEAGEHSRLHHLGTKFVDGRYVRPDQEAA